MLLPALSTAMAEEDSGVGVSGKHMMLVQIRALT